MHYYSFNQAKTLLDCRVNGNATRPALYGSKIIDLVNKNKTVTCITATVIPGQEAGRLLS